MKRVLGLSTYTCFNKTLAFSISEFLFFNSDFFHSFFVCFFQRESIGTAVIPIFASAARLWCFIIVDLGSSYTNCVIQPFIRAWYKYIQLCAIWQTRFLFADLLRDDSTMLVRVPCSTLSQGVFRSLWSVCWGVSTKESSIWLPRAILEGGSSAFAAHYSTSNSNELNLKLDADGTYCRWSWLP